MERGEEWSEEIKTSFQYKEATIFARAGQGHTSQVAPPLHKQQGQCKEKTLFLWGSVGTESPVIGAPPQVLGAESLKVGKGVLRRGMRGLFKSLTWLIES